MAFGLDHIGWLIGTVGYGQILTYEFLMLVSGLSPKQFDIIKTEIDFDTTAMQK